MKILISIIALVVINATQAADTPSSKYMSKQDQHKTITEIATAIRASLWSAGHEDVSSNTFFVTKSYLDKHVSSTQQYEHDLEKKEVSKIYRCYYSETCELYYVGTTSTYYSGYGEDANFILFYPRSGKHFKINHIIYSE